MRGGTVQVQGPLEGATQGFVNILYLGPYNGNVVNDRRILGEGFGPRKGIQQARGTFPVEWRLDLMLFNQVDGN
jgi:hypothetical protein